LELRRNQGPIPPYIERLLRALDDVPADRSPSISPFDDGAA
jgi:hypothetical protein